MSAKKDTEKSPKWLKELQLKSWEPEILLSGIVLYGLFQAPGLLDQVLIFLKLNFFGTTTDFDNLIALLKTAIFWLTFGLILHLVSRGIWVGMVGLSFTFPNGINYDRMTFSPRFDKYLRKMPSMQSIIISLEKLCSALFSISFMLFMSMIGGYFYILVVVILPILSYVFIVLNGNFIEINITFWSIYIIMMMMIGVIGLLDFLTLGFLKRVKFLSKIYYPIYRFIRALTLARFYSPIYYSIVSNMNRWKISAFLMVFVVISIFLVGSYADEGPGDDFSRISLWNISSETSAFNGYYDDQNENKYSLRAQIQSDIIRGNTIRLFVVARADMEDSIRSNCNYDSLIENTDLAKKFRDNQCIEEFYRIQIDDSSYQHIQWKFHYKAHTQQKGFLTWINIRNLEEGLHELKVFGPEQMYSYPFASIPFYHEISDSEFYLRPESQPSEEGESYLKLKPILPK